MFSWPLSGGECTTACHIFLPKGDYMMMYGNSLYEYSQDADCIVFVLFFSQFLCERQFHFNRDPYWTEF